ncbi:D-sedoheptulose 7-phosphate isomerase [Agrobacterium vitis]|nr:D-sedoheptulose 7-phosphate isomerase [Agrobacterium vitis]MBE1436637.1 D-sedoheptulose 7-phosphate isomerase [Agrobacterium vitis]
MNFTIRTSLHDPILRYLNDLSQAIGELSVDDIEVCLRPVVDCMSAGGTVFIAGNGGSASNSIHMASDWSIHTRSYSPMPRIVALAENIARLTALANDVSYEDVFAEQLGGGVAGDVLLILSVSGDSENLVRAAREAKRRNMTVVSLLGRKGLCADISDFSMSMGDADYGLVEDLHSAFTHIVVRMLNGGQSRRHENQKKYTLKPLKTA